MIKNYFKTAFRNLLRSKVYSLINISGLSVGLACCMLIFLYGKDETSYDRFQKNKDQLYRIVVNMTGPDGKINKFGSTGMMPGPAFKESILKVEDFVRVQSASLKLSRERKFFARKHYTQMKIFSLFFLFHF